MDLSDVYFEIGRKLNPRRKLGSVRVRDYEAACQWSLNLDWRKNPYDRFLLCRELLLHFERLMHEDARSDIFAFASRSEIVATIEWLFGRYEQRCSEMTEAAGFDFQKVQSVFAYVAWALPSYLQHVYDNKGRYWYASKDE
ncbi:MAG: hypothetical protein EOP84_03605 [Verrucomicrobiaceae bacterium]|nr:MAG: hypothetical protein EOP84_03605 [Verrucomicrobiaceae bacterium]